MATRKRTHIHHADAVHALPAHELTALRTRGAVKGLTPPPPKPRNAESSTPPLAERRALSYPA